MKRKPPAPTSLVAFEIRTAHGPSGLFTMGSRSVLDSHNLDAQLVTQADLEQLRQLIDEMLPRHAHNSKPSDPDAHVLFDSVCCGARLYRCSRFVDAGLGDGFLPSKPKIYLGEDGCASCGAALGEEAF